METLQSAVTREYHPLLCARKATYPESLTYLKKHYGLTYDCFQIFCGLPAIGRQYYA